MDKIDGLLNGLTTQVYANESMALAQDLEGYVKTGEPVKLTVDEAVYLGDKIEALRDQLLVIEEAVELSNEAGGLISWMKRTLGGKDDSAIETFEKEIKGADTAGDITGIISQISDFILEVEKVQSNKFTWKTFAKYSTMPIVVSVGSTVYMSLIKKKLDKYHAELKRVKKLAEEKEKQILKK
jgi:hypothetical protein